MTNKIYEPVGKLFLGEEVRAIKTDDKHEYLICEDMFNVLGFVKADGTWNNARETMLELLNGINREDTYQKLKIIQDKNEREIECLDIKEVPIVVSQFKPSEENEKILKKWAKFMSLFGEIIRIGIFSFN